MKKKILISILSFGDFVIDYSHYKASRNEIDEIFVGEHLRPIANALGVEDEVKFIDVGNDIPPRLFNFRKSGFLQIIKSFFIIRNALHAFYGRYVLYVVPHMNFRWRILMGFKDYEYVRKRKENIYTCYENKYTSARTKPMLVNPQGSDVVYIFPESRQVEKSLKREDLETVTALLKAQKINYRIVLVGEAQTYADVSEKHYISSLSELVSCVQASRFCISADSLPVHLAVFYNKSIFVFAARRNDTLFPKSVLRENAWDTFGSNKKLEVWLNGR